MDIYGINDQSRLKLNFTSNNENKLQDQPKSPRHPLSNPLLVISLTNKQINKYLYEIHIFIDYCTHLNKMELFDKM